ncbi:MAG: hypothetical protein F6K03_18585, partial [Kamptonema sp. SIO4C4]|nr:hypothetical protein [Kamptonema sp. SIO4C4]
MPYFVISLANFIMLNGYQVLDADAHVYEPYSLWQEYLEPAFREFAPSVEMKVQGEAVIQHYSDTLIQEGMKQVARSHPHSLAQNFSPESQIRAMYQMGVDVAFVYPTHLL